MELTKKEGEILDFIKKYKCCKKEHIQAFIDVAQLDKRLIRLVWRNEIIIEDEIIKLKENNVDLEGMREQLNMIKVLDVVTLLKNEGRIKEIEIMDLPYYIMARSAKKDVYMYFTFVNKGLEMIKLKLIDNENKGNTMLILENSTQIEYLKILTTKVKKVIIYEDFLKTNQI
ncbi:hypothetical protein JYG23_12320 [Sedimentibacter sp. zth1]|uniref:DUF5697 family protein n=1 Tax=Sedimentibacter sp. zth1 TaxID=2816908 RepID=UPI001A9373C0|nr:DUF5697 family protein [Sedimentibacter sp. zth1]QSX05453.1 hypothetical protein JYG23_12320 [Sedimentibacter sp. zth1]